MNKINVIRIKINKNKMNKINVIRIKINKIMKIIKLKLSLIQISKS
jgi:hypothetical protein